MKKKLLAVFAHPDDESFGPGGTLAKYAKEGAEIHILCATRGQAGKGDTKLRANELLEAAKVLGVKKVIFLDYMDGKLCNGNYHELAGRILEEIKSFKPQVLLSYENLGVSGHLDHILVSLAATYAFIHQKITKKLYFYCIPKWRARLFKRYFVYFPPGYTDQEITTTIDIEDIWNTRIAAMRQHKSQIHDVNRIIRKSRHLPRKEYFLLFDKENGVAKVKENDFFEGIV